MNDVKFISYKIFILEFTKFAEEIFEIFYNSVVLKGFNL